MTSPQITRIASAFALLAVLLTGCTADQRPKYVAPQLAPEQAATIQTNGSMFVDSIDGARIDSTKISVLGMGGEKVVVAPGEHQLGLVWQSGSSYARFNIKHSFTAGHKYMIGPDNWLMPRFVKVTDQTTNSSVIIQQ